MAKHIYVHIPFCIRKCDYCDFYSVSQCEKKISSYFDALMREIEITQVVDDTNDDDIDTVYFGGGTPSVPDSRLICDCLVKIIDKFDIKTNAEITIECNPASVNRQKFGDYKRAGFNRVSIGIQSLYDETLKTLGRLHNRERAIEAIREAKEVGFTNISADLMLGIPGQTLDEVIANAKLLVELGVTHVSMYSLIIEEGTKFYDRYVDTLEDYMPQELERQMYHSLRSYLEENGITPYEISNCGVMSVHNTSYWKGYEYYAFGPASSGFIQNKRFTHMRDLDNYINVLLSDEPDLTRVIEIDEELTKEDKMHEYAMLMLRTSYGIVESEFIRRFGTKVLNVFSEEIENLLGKGLIIHQDGTYVLSSKGLDFANEVFREFV